MKVVFSSFFKPGEGGGDARVAQEISQAFAKQGHQVLFVQPGKENSEFVKDVGVRVCSVKSVGEENVSIPALTPKSIKFIFSCLKEFSPDVVHGQDPGPLAYLLQFWAKENKVPFFFTSHVLPTRVSEFGGQTVSPLIDKFFESSLFESYFANFFENCDAVIALNKANRRDIRTYGYEGNIFTIPNGRNLSLYTCLPYPDNNVEPVRLLFVGFISRRKNQKFLLQVKKHLPAECHLDLVGGVLEEDYFSELNQFIEKNKLKNVKFWGQVTHEKVVELLGKSTLFVSASQLEVQSLVILEALAAGRPVIGLDNETVGELVDEDVGVKLPADTTPVNFAKELENLLSYPSSKFNKICKNARSRVTPFDWENVVKRTVSAYEKLCSAKLEKRHVSWEEQDLSKWEEIRGGWLKNWRQEDKKTYQYSWWAAFPVILVSLLGTAFYSLRDIWVETVK
ncbi:MAG: glycosyltransferase family 4 protein [Patescibacteria group bacterium]